MISEKKKGGRGKEPKLSGIVPKFYTCYVDKCKEIDLGRKD